MTESNRRPTTRPRTRHVSATVLVVAVALVLLGSPSTARTGDVRAAWPASKLDLGTSASVAGRVTGLSSGTRVLLQQRVLGGWRTVEDRSLGAGGRYRIPVPTWWTGRRTYRVAAGSGSGGPVASSPSWRVDVTPGYSPAGTAGQHRYSLRSPTRWDPCRVIGYRVNARQARRGWKRDVRGAFDRISRATGFRFAYRGTTRRVPQSGQNRWFPSDTDIVVAWARPRQSSLLRRYPGAAGVGSALSTSGWHNGDGRATYRIERGMVVIDSRMKRRGGFGRGVTRGDLLLHEIGHTMGMSHVGGRRQIMYPRLTRGKARFGRGDFTGLEKRGARLGCLSRTGLRSARTTTGPSDVRVVASR